jgi:hypothetical protein
LITPGYRLGKILDSGYYRGIYLNIIPLHRRA